MPILLIIKIITEVYNPAHAGQLVQEWLDGLKEEGTPVTVTQLANSMCVTRTALSRMINGHTALTADMALRLQAALGINADLLMRVQAGYEIWQASQLPRPHIMLLVTHQALLLVIRGIVFLVTNLVSPNIPLFF